jgi:hypothetical protein
MRGVGMEFMLVNMQGLNIRGPRRLIVRTSANPDAISAFRITEAVRAKMWWLIAADRAEEGPNQFYETIAALPPENGDRGIEFYVNSSSFVVLRDCFSQIVWSCIHEELGEELD